MLLLFYLELVHLKLNSITFYWLHKLLKGTKKRVEQRLRWKKINCVLNYAKLGLQHKPLKAVSQKMNQKDVLKAKATSPFS